MHVRMRQTPHQAAGTAFAARLQAGALAEDQLRQPEREPLLAHTRRPGHEQDLGQAPRPHRASDHASLVGVAQEGFQWHGEKVRIVPGNGRRQKRNSFMYMQL